MILHVYHTGQKILSLIVITSLSSKYTFNFYVYALLAQFYTVLPVSTGMLPVYPRTCTIDHYYYVHEAFLMIIKMIKKSLSTRLMGGCSAVHSLVSIMKLS